MPLIVPTTDIIQSPTIVQTDVNLFPGDTVFIMEGINLVSTEGLGFFLLDGADYDFLIDGTVAAEVNALFASDGGSVTLIVSETGTMTSGNSAVFWSGFGEAVADDDVLISNAGHLSSRDAGPIFVIGDPNSIRISNTGTIQAVGNGIGASAIGISGQTDVFIGNSGTISTITPSSGPGFDTITVTANSLELINSGLIESGGVAIQSFADTTEVIDNSGEIRGDVDLWTIDSQFTNAGRVVGDVLLNFGNDTYEGLVDGHVTGAVFGSFGEDTLRGSNARDHMHGEYDNDEIWGRGGDDTLTGGSGEDFIHGGDGDDRLIGGQGNDTMHGGNGNDRLFGANDDDVMRGNDGDDELIGGPGGDTLFGGDGADTFIYRAVSHSPRRTPGEDTRDHIMDFTQGEDVIDLSSIAGGSLNFLGSDPFTASGSAEFRVVSTGPGGSTLVRVDNDGDGDQEMAILVRFVDSMTAEDFLF